MHFSYFVLILCCSIFNDRFFFSAAVLTATLLLYHTLKPLSIPFFKFFSTFFRLSPRSIVPQPCSKFFHSRKLSYYTTSLSSCQYPFLKFLGFFCSFLVIGCFCAVSINLLISYSIFDITAFAGEKPSQSSHKFVLLRFASQSKYRLSLRESSVFSPPNPYTPWLAQLQKCPHFRAASKNFPRKAYILHYW